MIVTTRRARDALYLEAEQKISAIYSGIALEVRGLLLNNRHPDNPINPVDLDSLQGAIPGIVGKYFYTETQPGPLEVQAERDRLEALRDRALSSSDRNSRARALSLSYRIGALAGLGVAYDTLNSPYGNIVTDLSDRAIRTAILPEQQMMLNWLAVDPGSLAQLQAALPRRLPIHQTTLLWEDTRGYRLSDRIWGTSQATRTGINQVLEDGIMRNRAAVDVATDLEQYLRTEGPVTLTPYGRPGSYYARRLARSEITRSHSVATALAGASNPFVNRAYYNLANTHKNDEGDVCEAHAARSKQEDGFPPEHVPIPMVDTHPHCKCFITHRAIREDAAVESIRQTLNRAETTEEVPLTPLAINAMVISLMGSIHVSEAITPGG